MLSKLLAVLMTPLQKTLNLLRFNQNERSIKFFEKTYKPLRKEINFQPRQENESSKMLPNSMQLLLKSGRLEKM